MPHALTPFARSAARTGIGLAVTAVVATGVAATAATAVAAVWRGVERRAAIRVGIDPAALHLHSSPARPPSATETVSVLIPMRHEPGPAIAAVRAALRQHGVDNLDVVVLDDVCPQETRAALRGEFADDQIGRAHV